MSCLHNDERVCQSSFEAALRWYFSSASRRVDGICFSFTLIQRAGPALQLKGYDLALFNSSNPDSLPRRSSTDSHKSSDQVIQTRTTLSNTPSTQSNGEDVPYKRAGPRTTNPHIVANPLSLTRKSGSSYKLPVGKSIRI